MLNHIVVQGRLGRDPELRYTQNQIPVASFSLAVERDMADQQTGQRATDWIDVVAWRKTAEFASKYFRQGQMCVVSGRLQIRDWTDRDGNKRKQAEIMAQNLYFAGPKQDGEGQSGRSDSGNSRNAPSGGAYRPAGNAVDISDYSDVDGELPF